MLLGASFIPCAGLPCCRASDRLYINHLLLSLSMPLLSIVTDYLQLFLKAVAHISMVVFLLGSHLYFSSITMGRFVFLNPKSLFPFGSHCFVTYMSYFFSKWPLENTCQKQLKEGKAYSSSWFGGFGPS